MARLESQAGIAAPIGTPTTKDRCRTARGTMGTSTVRYRDGSAFFSIYIACEKTGAMTYLTLDPMEAANLERNLRAFVAQIAQATTLEVAETFAEPEPTDPEHTPTLWIGDHASRNYP